MIKDDIEQLIKRGQLSEALLLLAKEIDILATRTDTLKPHNYYFDNNGNLRESN